MYKAMLMGMEEELKSGRVVFLGGDPDRQKLGITRFLAMPNSAVIDYTGALEHHQLLALSLSQPHILASRLRSHTLVCAACRGTDRKGLLVGVTALL